MTFKETIVYLDSFINHEQAHRPKAMRAMKLERMRRLCRRLGEPQRRFRSILVAGTNGKGSICAMLYSMLRQTSLRVGLYTSPHLEHIRERIRIGGGASVLSGQDSYGSDWISESDFAALVSELKPVFEEFRNGAQENTLTYFEALTALTLMYFAKKEVDVAVIEVGLGGRLDATNVIEQAISVIAPIGVDHTDVLGKDPVTIAREKAGIIKGKQTIVSSVQRPDVAEVIRGVCEEKGVPLVMCGLDVTVVVQGHSPDGLSVSIAGLRGIYDDIELPMLGRHQAENACVAVTVLELLADVGIPYTIVKEGLTDLDWPGRLELVHDEPIVLLDGGHNRLAVEALRSAIKELWPGRTIHVLIGISLDKPAERVGEILGPISASITCSKSRHPRAMDSKILAEKLSKFCPDIHVISDPFDAYTVLLNTADSKDVIVVTGSFFFIGEIRAALRQSHIRPRRMPAEI